MAQRHLNQRQQAFIAEYLISLNASDAYRKAGYAAKNANISGPQLLSNPSIAKAVATAMAERSTRMGITADMVLKALAKIGFASMRAFISVDAEGQPRIDLSANSGDSLDALSEVSTETVLESKGSCKDAPTADSIRKTRIKLHDKLAALELIGKHLGMWKERIEVDASDALTELIKSVQGTAYPISTAKWGGR